ncbi:uncharacterized protein VTP21DRAFT_4450 [Calcarisporiella thermophila]|uniref:uncharacterized protein n=1 Tax=Calcarisporiella thermophila TaxID=911321 RepID=UPI0037428788
MVEPIVLCIVRALYDYQGSDSSSLNFQKGDVIEVLNQLETGWWDGVVDGKRGWFPSNYVEVIEKYDSEDESGLEEVDENDEENVWVPQTAPSGNVFYFNTVTGESVWELPVEEGGSPYTQSSRNLDSTQVCISLENGSAWPIGSENAHYEFRLFKVYPKLSGSWTMQKAPDGMNYFYNTVTQEVRWSLPSAEELRGDAKERKPSLNQDLPPNWERKTTRQGRVYYYNPVLDETTWTLDKVDPVTGQLRDKPAENETLQSPVTPLQQEPPILPHNLSVSNQAEPRHPRSESPIGSISWAALVSNINAALDALKQRRKQKEKVPADSHTNSVIGSVRLLLHACDCLDRESPHLQKNRNLRAGRRAITTALAKLTLSAKLASGILDSADYETRIQEEAASLFAAVEHFVEVAQKDGVELREADPHILKEEIAGKMKKPSLLFSAKVGEEPPGDGDDASSAGTDLLLRQMRDLETQLEEYAQHTIKLSGILLDNMELTILQPSKSLQLHKSSELLGQANELVGLISSLLALTEESTFIQKLPGYSSLQHSRQSLYNEAGAFILASQAITQPDDSSLQNSLIHMQHTARRIVRGTKDVAFKIKNMWAEVEKNNESRRPSAVRIKEEPGELDRIDEEWPEEEMCGEKGRGSTASDKTMVQQGAKMQDLGFLSLGPDVSSLGGPEKSAGEAKSKSTEDKEHRRGTEDSIGGATLHDPESRRTSNATSETGNDLKSEKLRKFFGEDPMEKGEKGLHTDQPWYLRYDVDPDELLLTLDGTVKGGTLRGLIERLTMHDQHDPNFNSTFLLTYRSFTTTEKFFLLLSERFVIQEPPGLTEQEHKIWVEKKQKPIRLRVFNVMKTWLENHYMDESDARVLPMLREFASGPMLEQMPTAAEQLIKLIDRRMANPLGRVRKMVAKSGATVPPSIVPKNLRKIKFLELDPLELARQLTLMDSKLYNKIKPTECLNKAWSMLENEEVAENIKSLIGQSNQMTCWVAESILTQVEMKKRTALIKHFVAVAEKCRSLNNFNTCMAIVAGLDSSAVFRLRRTWEMVNQKTMQTLSQLKKLMNSMKNFAEYREVLRMSEPPCVPFLGVYLTDLTFIDDGNSNYIKRSRELINFAKHAMTAEVISEIQRYQVTPYALAPVPEIQFFLRGYLQASRPVEELYPLSLSLEPRRDDD